MLMTETCETDSMLSNIVFYFRKFHPQNVLRNPSVLWSFNLPTEKKKLSAFHSNATEKRRRNKRNLAFMFVFIRLFNDAVSTASVT